MSAKKVYNSIINTTPSNKFEILTYGNSFDGGVGSPGYIDFDIATSVLVDWGNGDVETLNTVVSGSLFRVSLQKAYGNLNLKKITITIPDIHRIVSFSLLSFFAVGNLSTVIAEFKILKTLDIQQNNFDSIPPSIYQIQLKNLLMGGSPNFSGIIPDEIFMISSLESFAWTVNKNNSLSYLDMNYNRLKELSNLKSLNIAGSLHDNDVFPADIYDCPVLETLVYSNNHSLSTSVANLNDTLKNYTFTNGVFLNATYQIDENLCLLTNLVNIDLSYTYYLDNNLPTNFKNFVNAKSITFAFANHQNNYNFGGWTTTQLNNVVDQIYAIVTTYATGSGSIGNWRGVSINILSANSVGGTYQAPSGFVLGVSNGTPASAKEKIYVLNNNYGHTWSYS